MKCPYCRAKTQVTNSRPQLKANAIWRRRACSSCSAVVSSQELFDYGTVLHVQKKTADNQPFSRDVLFASILIHLDTTAKAAKDAGMLCDTVIISLLKPGKALIPSVDIQNEVESVLGRFDPLAALKYASAHARIGSKRQIKAKLKELGS